MNKLTIGLIGNPNAGKTTLFNQLTGSRQRVGNWAGVTVERMEGEFIVDGQQVQLIDLPGTYSLTTLSAQTSLDEQIACHFILGREADLLINVLDASNLERNLYLTLQILESGMPCILALNMLDIARSQRVHIDIHALSRRLGCPVVQLVSTRGTGIDALKKAITGAVNLTPPLPVVYPAAITEALDLLIPRLPASADRDPRYWLALQILEGDIHCCARAGVNRHHLEIIRDELDLSLGDEPALIIADARYGEIGRICQSVSRGHQAEADRGSHRLDGLALNRWLGIPFFFLVMYLMFFMAINVGGAFKPFFELGSAALFIDGAQWLGHTLDFPYWLTRLLAQGIGCGINTLLPLIPQIGMMYLFLSFLEETGYMARAAFVMDRMMLALGLPGKSFVPLIVGFGCNVPAVMAARTLDGHRERLMTIMMAPFMSCGARLAIFAVFAAAFFGQHGTLAVFSLYLLGIAVAILTGLMLKLTIMRGEATPFIMELPVYHVPHIKSLLTQTWQRLKMFLLGAGKVIIAAGIFIGMLSSFTLRGTAADTINSSALASLGKSMTPILAPMGVAPDNWQATVGLMSGVLAKEVVVGTLNQLYTAENMAEASFDADEYDLLALLTGAVTQTRQQLLETLSLSTLSNPIEASKGDGEMSGGAMGIMSEKFGGAVAAYSYLIFVLLYVPCVSVMGAISRESNRGWMSLSVFWGINVAYSLATLFYQGATFAAHPAQSMMAILLVLTANALFIFALYLLRHRFALSLARTEPDRRHTASGQCCHQGE
ncbi:Fe(2+) transporter permease subunit FeoB [Sodalis sp. dw_96]|uniref:Fe(2+) transporter permease subunit FeoB n=1 Tax=Sodalis sp. dw_96 TaxID=2719794 RepID=UPI001BD671EF|nr:Fe(2+) transporter permease subunit FeoB [Sodalis sp. dw_96]